MMLSNEPYNWPALSIRAGDLSNPEKEIERDMIAEEDERVCLIS
jgi:hypothetical protein